MSFDFRKATKLVVKTVVANGLGYVSTKMILSTFPKTKTLRVAGMAGEIIGGLIATKLDDRIDDLVDDFFDARLEAKVDVEYEDDKKTA